MVVAGNRWSSSHNSWTGAALAAQQLHQQDLIKVFTRCLVKAGTTSHRWEMLGWTQVKLSRSFSRWVGRCSSAPSGVHLTTSGTHSQTGPQPPPPASYLSHARVMQCCIPFLTNVLESPFSSLVTSANNCYMSAYLSQTWMPE